jgi:transposase
LIAGISIDKGLDYYELYPRSINTESFEEFITTLAKKNKGKKLALFMDNLSVHRSTYMMKLYDKLKIKAIFNLPYSPQYNGIESYFSCLKHYYKNLLL